MRNPDEHCAAFSKSHCYLSRVHLLHFDYLEKHPMSRSAEDSSGGWPGKDRQGRLSLKRRCRVARNPGRRYWDRHPERPAVRVTPAEGCRIRTAEGLQREYRRVDQRWHHGARYGGSHRELERADGSHVCAATLAGSDTGIEEHLPV